MLVFTNKMFYYKIKLIFGFCFVLMCCVTKAATLPTKNLSHCNCVLLKSCEVFNALIDNSNNDSHTKAVILEAVCFFDGINIFVCCPNKLNHKRNVKEKPKLDYLDDLTGLNCPPTFGYEYNYDDYLKSNHETESKYYEDHPHSRNYGYGNDHPNVFCDKLGNCGSFSFPHNNNEHHGHSQQHPLYHHNRDRDHDHHEHIPFFPNTPTNQNNREIVTQTIGKGKINNCGMLPQVSSSDVEVYPWITRLAYLNTTSRTIGYRCMGTIISDQHILTAAHCVDRLVQDLRLIYVRIGDDTNFDDYKILETIVHPNYNEPLFNNDVALLRLAITSQSKGPLINICLPQNNSNSLTGDTGIVAGWSSGGISTTNKSSTIRYINLPIMNNTECAIRYAKYSENFETSIVITPTEFCAKAQAMNDVCEGDSGGPFMVRSKSLRFTLLGIVAFGPKTNCGQSNLPGVYMRVSSYVDWIEHYIK